MTSAIMNPVALPVGPRKLEEKRAELAAAGIIVPETIDPQLLATITGLGSIAPCPGKEMEMIRAANLLSNHDLNGSAWIQFNRPARETGQTSSVNGTRRARRRRDNDAGEPN
jgi:5-methyltetrahydrofolate--homocysteine methyltransferase